MPANFDFSYSIQFQLQIYDSILFQEFANKFENHIWVAKLKPNVDEKFVEVF